MDDSVAQFFVTVGRLCADARLARLTVRLRLRDGRELIGVPAPPPEAEDGDELDKTGLSDVVTVGGVEVQLSDVVEASIRRPDDGSAEQSAA